MGRLATGSPKLWLTPVVLKGDSRDSEGPFGGVRIVSIQMVKYGHLVSVNVAFKWSAYKWVGADGGLSVW